MSKPSHTEHYIREISFSDVLAGGEGENEPSSQNMSQVKYRTKETKEYVFKQVTQIEKHLLKING